MLLAIVLFPMLLAVPCHRVFTKSRPAGHALTALVPALTAAACGVLLYGAAGGAESSMMVPGVLGMGLSFRADGFRAAYALLASLAWLATALYEPEYLLHGGGHGRYALFKLLTLGAALGVFLSDDLYTAFVFFEIMSFTSYPFVAHEQDPGAVKAAATYLAVAVLGGMLMLMGLVGLRASLGTLSYPLLPEAVSRRGSAGSLYFPGALVLLGFGAKAGMFPLHIWLPKAHPVAPAPLSALLSGVLTKIGVFGVLVLCARVFMADVPFGRVLLALGTITMLLGAVLALLSNNLKRTLACSSLSQIGFILTGCSAMVLLGEHNALAAGGTVLHMVNHSLIKLVLFLSAGTVMLKTGTLSLDGLRGYGRKKPLLHLCFLIAALSISGVPLFSGYVSKTLLHESLLEYLALLSEHGVRSVQIQLSEWTFTLTGGLTFCYMLKLYLTLFWQKHPTRQEEFDRSGPAMKPLSALPVAVCAAALLLMGLFPHALMDPVASLSAPFLRAHPPAHAVDYLSLTNLAGAFKSLLIGAAVYLLAVRLLLTRRENGVPSYRESLPLKLDLEERVYKPGVRRLVGAGMRLANALDEVEEHVQRPLLKAGFQFSRTADRVGKLPGPVESRLTSRLEAFLARLDKRKTAER